MINDLIEGAVLPPLVLGIVVGQEQFSKIKDTPIQELENSLIGELKDKLSIIDGMQRTTALKEAHAQHEPLGDQVIRVECWLASTTDSLIYRMLVLNTGQVPWNLKRQLQVVYSALIEELKGKVNFVRLLDQDKGERRTRGGEFSPDSLVEAYLAFGLRKTDIDTQETLAEEFSRLDVAEAISTEKYSKYFAPIVQLMVDLDCAFSRLDILAPADEHDAESAATRTKYKIGRHIFDTQPARVGFVVSAAIAVLGRISGDRTSQDSDSVLDRLKQQVAGLQDRMAAMKVDELKEFLALDILSERIFSPKRSAIGRHERSFFETAFKVLIDEGFDPRTLEVCWRS
ncbi:hypothetical protein ACRRPB_004944 [Pseudomonas aeruginosa]|uniref:hypothetical protein n=1 Tax=Pseudomonas aeruginosa TaxID=287 RepID=UPI002363984C|nr:hypothetical protein [Pseudomonas aeruginosa]EKU9158418.1 hypothetical protein [Pseudomonas aeruginosa]ELQ8106959.1 hypothetical protein [Pseudomonas aeruginosa]MDD1819698.1 hypothetical protein [Pseudomonas aeruginosa]HBP0351572.1 hypothetical protein [Pseudomonas aeruginosa]